MNEERNGEEQQRYAAGATTAVLADPSERREPAKSLELRPPESEPRAAVDALSSNGASIAANGTATAVAMDEEVTALFSSEEAKDFRTRWDAIQGGFVDAPRRAVEQADSLVGGTMKRLAEVFADERARLEGQWDREESVSTEDLRLALRRYRSFFSRLLMV
jgi:hypothetical protein